MISEMNSEIVFNIRYITYDGKYHVYDINGYKIRTNNIQKIVNKFMDIFEYADLVGEIINNIRVQKNNIWFDVETRDGKIRTTNIAGYIRTFNHRCDFELEVLKRGDTLIDTYVDAKSHVLINHNCGHPAHRVTPNNYLSHSGGCPICSGYKVVPYINDCYTLRPDLLKYFVNPNDSIGLPLGNHDPILFRCPECGHIRENTINNVAYSGFACQVCGDGIKYPEKITRNILDQLHVDYLYHKTPSWSFFDINGKRHTGEYDFIIEDIKLIIEVDGLLHDNNNKSNWHHEDQELIDENKTKLAIKNGYDIIRINAMYKQNHLKYQHMRRSIIESLSDYFDLSDIDWDIANTVATSSIVIAACKLWENGLIVDEIKNQLKLSNVAIIEYLKRGHEMGICSYSHELSNLRQAKNISSKYYIYAKMIDYNTDEVLGVFYDIDNFIYNVQLLTNKRFGKQPIRAMIFNRLDVQNYISFNNTKVYFRASSQDEYLGLINDVQFNDVVDNISVPIVMSCAYNIKFYDKYKGEKQTK